MSNVVEFIYRLQDQVSGTLTKIAGTATKVAGNMHQVQTANQGVSNSNREVASSSSMAERGFSNLAKMAGAYIGVMQGFRATKWFGGLGMDMEQTRAKFEVMLGSLEKGNAMIAKLNEFANKTPFENADLIKNSETMLAFGINSEKILPTLKSLGDVAMGDKNKLSGLTLAYSQAASTGRLMGQDLLQMINQGFNPLLIISQKTGKSMAELKKEMEAGRISFDMVEDAFRTATSEGGQFYGMMDKMSEKASGKWSNFMGNLTSKLTEYSERITPFIGMLFDFGIKLVDNFDQIASVIWRILTPVRALVVGLAAMVTFFANNHAALIALVVVLSTYRLLMWQAALAAKGWTIASIIQFNWLVLLEKAQALLNATILKSPIMWIVAGIGLLVGWLIILKKRTKEAVDEVYNLNAAAQKHAADERARLDMIFDKLRKTNPKSEERNKLAKELNRMYPDTLKNINLEKAGLEELESAYNKIVDAINRKAMARAAEDRLVELYKQINSLQASNVVQVQKSDAIPEVMASYGGITSDVNASQRNVHKGIIDVNNAKIKNLKDQVASLNKTIFNNESAAMAEGLLDGGGGGGGATSSVGGLTSSGRKQTNININFRNLIENYHSKAVTVADNAREVEDKLIESLLRVVNSANTIATQ